MGVRFKSFIAMARKSETATLILLLFGHDCCIFYSIHDTKWHIIPPYKIAVILKFQSLELNSSILFSIWVYLVHSKLIILCLFFIFYLLDQFDIQDQSKNFIDHSNHKNTNDNRYDDNHRFINKIT